MRLFAPKRESGMQKICAATKTAMGVMNFTPCWRIKRLPQGHSRIMLRTD
jgi:hypothetical protein